MKDRRSGRPVSGRSRERQICRTDGLETQQFERLRPKEGRMMPAFRR